jgi:septal ring factor EnvC (AmiA/AmiB activator)
MGKVDKFASLFSDFDLVIKPRKERETSEIKPSKIRLESIERAKVELKKTLKRLNREYSSAKKAFKANKLSKYELFDFEWRIFEVQEEIKRLEDEENENSGKTV